METTSNRSKRSSRIGIILGYVTLMYICSLEMVNAGGKGKVPIYMPIPIPVPMPMGNSDGYRQPQQQQHHQQDGEGEVKKIYLLQPMPKMNPQLKGGGYVGPVQTHIHLPSPVIPQSGHRRPHSQPQKLAQNYDGDTGGLQESHERKSHGGGGKSYSNEHTGMKILPIVVIPPIAPIPPIQVNSDNQTPRMSLIPQINNYLSSEINRERVSRNHHERKSRSDSYGGSGGGAVFRETLGSRGRLRSRQGFGSSSRMRSRFQDDFNDDYDYGGPPSYQSRSRSNMHSRANRWTPSRRRLYTELSGRSGRMIGQDSIRDIIDQQVHFDDDIDRPSRQSDCCEDPKRSSRLSSLIDSASEQIDSREPSTSHSELMHHLKSRERLQLESDLGDPVELTGENHSPTKSRSDLTYYEHDLPHSTDSSHYRESKSPKRLYLDEHEALNDDEWIFDTVKSVKHADPNVNGTSIVVTENINATTIVPPLNATKVE